jgi:hypothetical protein
MDTSETEHIDYLLVRLEFFASEFADIRSSTSSLTDFRFTTTLSAFDSTNDSRC